MPTIRLTYPAAVAAAANLPSVVDVAAGSGDPLDETLAVLSATGANPAPPGTPDTWTFSAVATHLASGQVGPRPRRAATQGWRHAGYRNQRDAICAVAAAGYQLGAPAGFTSAVLAHPACRFGPTGMPKTLIGELEHQVRVTLRRSDAKRAAAVEAAAVWARTVPIEMNRPATARAILETLARLAAVSCRVAHGPAGMRVIRVAASSRQVASEANLHPATVRRTLDRLCELGVVGCVSRGDARNAAVWELDAPTATVTAQPEPETVWDDLGVDAAHAHAVGKTLAATLREMLPGVGYRTAELAERLGATQSAVRVRMNRLRRAGLVQRDGKLWYASTIPASEVARRYGTDGTRARRRVQYRQERAARAARRTGAA